jgi:cell division protein FtsI/penicillin-binding protein 2
MFFLLKDLGPALVTGFLFLAIFGVARNRPGLAIVGIALLIAGVTLGYRSGTPHTVVDRINMWLSPWDNSVRGGDQLAHALWALATGGPTGSGPGLGDPVMIPAGHTDLVLPAIGEEWGFCCVAIVALLFLFLCGRAFAIAKYASDDYGVFLAVGFGTLIALEMLLISGGALGAIPLSGVASPFLSAGNTAMLANFFIFAVLLAISAHSRTDSPARPFLRGIRGLSIVAGTLGFALVARAAVVQLMHADDLIARDTIVYQQDGVRRPQHNPRLNSLAHELTRGTIYDRNGVVLASSRSQDIEQQRAILAKFNITPEQNCSPQHNRCYPFGTVTRHLLGDWTTGENFHASNSSLIEHDQNAKLQGYSDLHELAGYIRYRHRPGNRALQELLGRDRSVRSSIDIRLQLRAEAILNQHLQSLHKDKGALVVMNAQTGDVLAVASAPEPVLDGPSTTDQLLDRARYGQYPPGSTFKLVTALAALQADPSSTRRRFHCAPLGDGRVGTRIPGWNRPIRDDVGDHAHGSPDMAQAITVSCNAYFAQLGVFVVGAKGLKDMADKLDIDAGDPKEIKKMLPFAAYGQGPVLMTPFKMARVAATIASGGGMPEGRWVVDDSNDRTDAPHTIVPRDQAAFIAAAMRSVVTGGTGRRAMMGVHTSVAGKTGTAQMDEGEPHSWFTGFAPYNSDAAGRIAFAVVVEHGGYGALAAAPVAKDIVNAAVELGIVAAAPEK